MSTPEDVTHPVSDKCSSEAARILITQLTPELSRAARDATEAEGGKCEEATTTPRSGVGLNELLGRRPRSDLWFRNPERQSLNLVTDAENNQVNHQAAVITPEL